MRVLITGAAGYLGRRVAATLAAAGMEPITAARTPGQADHAADLADRAAVDRLVRAAAPDAVVHAAAAVGGAGDGAFAARTLNDNVAATAHLAAAAVAAEVGRFVYCSTISVYGKRSADRPPFAEDDHVAPRGVYGRSKWLGEQAVALAAAAGAFTAVSLRYSGIHGAPRTGGAVAGMVRAALAGGDIAVSEPQSLFHFVFLDDAAAAVRHALTADLPAGHHAINIAGADAWSLTTWAERIAALAGTGAAIRTGDGAARQESMRIDRARALIGFAPGETDAHLAAAVADLRAAATAA